MPLGFATFKPRHASLAIPLAGAREKRCSRVVGTTLQVTEISLNPPLGWRERERSSTAAKSPRDAELGNLSRHPLNSETVQID